MITTVLLSFLFQAAGGAPPHSVPPAAYYQRYRQSIAPVAEDRPWNPLDEEQQFVQRLNGLALALSDFSHAYNSQGLIDVKNVKAIRKALRELEKSDWFNPKHETR